MHPVLFDLPWGPANAYGTLILLGGSLALLGVYWDARRRGIGGGSPGTFVIDFYLVLIFGAAIGGRLLHVLTVPTQYLNAPETLWSLQSTGFVFFGSLLAVLAGWAFLARRYNIALAEICDLGATWMGLGHAFGRLGCLLAGCCWGATTDLSWGISFPETSVLAQVDGAPMDPSTGTSVPLHPTQLYEAIGLLVLFAVLLRLRLRRGVETPWRQASRYAVGYGALRLVTEIFRADPRGQVLELHWPEMAQTLGLATEHPLGLSIGQLMALALLALGVHGLRLTRSGPGRTCRSSG